MEIFFLLCIVLLLFSSFFHYGTNYWFFNEKVYLNFYIKA